MSGNTYRSLLRWNLFYHFISWTSGNITFLQMVYRAIVMPLMILSVLFALGGIIVGGFVLYSWVEGYNPKYMEVPAWILWLRHTVGHEHQTGNEQVASHLAFEYKPIVRERSSIAAVAPPAIPASSSMTNSLTVSSATDEASIPTGIPREINGHVNTPDRRNPRSCEGDTYRQEACLTARLATADASLNSTYKEALRNVDTVGQLRLRHDERKWIRERDEECARFTEPHRSACALSKTAERVAILNSYAVLAN